MRTISTNGDKMVYWHDSRHDGATGKARLHGRYTYAPYRWPEGNIS